MVAGCGNFFLLSTLYLLYVELDVPDTDLRDPHHLLREGFLTPCAPKPDPEVTTTFP